MNVIRLLMTVYRLTDCCGRINGPIFFWGGPNSFVKGIESNCKCILDALRTKKKHGRKCRLVPVCRFHSVFGALRILDSWERPEGTIAL